jgi:DNA-binding response OmpR family regulator
MVRILIADDEEDGRQMLKGRLEKEGFRVLAAADGDQAYRMAVDSPPDIILSDVSMPGMGGVELCRMLKKNARTRSIPVMLLSGVHKDDTTQVEGMELGADDYVVKPYSPRVLMAKVRALLRRYAAPEELKDLLHEEGLTLDVLGRTASFKGRHIALTRKEFDLLLTFLRRRGRVLSVPYLLETVWGYDPADYNDPHTVQTHLSSLRRKIGPLGRRIVNLPGLGYRFDTRKI